MVEQRFIDYWRERQQQQIAQVEMLKQQAWQDVNQVVSILREKFGATRILVYGSFWAQTHADMIQFVAWLRQLAKTLEKA